MTKEFKLIEKLKEGNISATEYEQLLDTLSCTIEEKNSFSHLRGMTIQYGAYNVIFINGNLCEESRNTTIAHELLHLLYEDLNENSDGSFIAKENRINCLLNK